MIVLGLHFGHDAGVAVLRDGQIISCVIRERQVRVKHAMTLDVKTIRKALEDADIKNTEIDFCAITSTQGVELIVDDPMEVSISLGGSAQARGFPCTMDLEKPPAMSRRVFLSLFTKNQPNMSSAYTQALYSKYFPEYKRFEGKKNELCGWVDDYVYDDVWHPPKTLKALSTARLSSSVRNDSLRYGFHYPVSMSLQGCIIPSFFINHHACHAASSYYQSRFNTAAIFSQDGGSGIGYDSGMFYYGEENRLYPIAPHHSILGVLYDLVAFVMNLGESSAGKLMGLAAYGKPGFYDSKFLGNRNDLVRSTREIDAVSMVEHWLHHCLSLAKTMGYELEPFGDTARMTAPINADIAASTQKLFEETTLALTEVLHNYLRLSGIVVDSLCLSGGTALNCPSNSRLWREGRFKNVFVEPGCDDSGLAIGAALNCYHNILDQPLLKSKSTHFSSPFLGPRVQEADILFALEYFKDRIHFEKTPDWAFDAAHELARNHVIGWFYGRSEIGPRALGHRSILADARDARNWERVNRIKKRELWRPFAPAVLESEAEKWFSGIQLPSPYMLFNATVRSHETPAITHVDGSARIQTVNEGQGAFYDLLMKYFDITKVPMLLNTSFNGPGEPIVESPFDAVRFFVDSELDVLYLESYKIIRNVTSGVADSKKDSIENRKVATLNVLKFMTEIEQSQKKRQAVCFLVEANYQGFNIVVYEGRFGGLRHGVVNENHMLGLESLQERYGPENVIVCDSVDAVHVRIDLMRELQKVAPLCDKQSTPRLIESRHGFNIVGYNNKYWVVAQSAGPVDFRDSEQLRHVADSGQLFEAQIIEEAREVIDRMHRGESLS